MKILTGIDVPFIPFGGSLVCSNDWYSDLPNDVQVRFLTLPPPPDHQKWWSIEDVVMMNIKKARTQEGFMNYVTKLKEVVTKEIEQFQPDVIHCQHLNYGLSCAFGELETNIPRIGICHGTDVQAATGSDFFKDNLKQICDAMNVLIFPNQYMADDFFTVYGKNKAYKINALGIPDKFFGTKSHTLSFNGKRPLRLLYAGRLTQWKGPDIAVKSMAYVKHPIELTVIGNEDQKDYKESMLSFVQEHNLENKVSFMDQLPREELLDAFSTFDAIIFPSRRLEAFSLTVIEAQTQGLPLIYFPGGGITETVGNAGIMIHENTPEAVAQLLDTIYEQPELLETVQKAGYKNALKYKTSLSRDNLFAISRDLVTRRVD